MIDHLITQHLKGMDQVPYHCGLCMVNFRNVSKATKHVQKHHGDKDGITILKGTKKPLTLTADMATPLSRGDSLQIYGKRCNKALALDVYLKDDHVLQIHATEEDLFEDLKPQPMTPISTLQQTKKTVMTASTSEVTVPGILHEPATPEPLMLGSTSEDTNRLLRELIEIQRESLAVQHKTYAEVIKMGQGLRGGLDATRTAILENTTAHKELIENIRLPNNIPSSTQQRSPLGQLNNIQLPVKQHQTEVLKEKNTAGPDKTSTSKKHIPSTSRNHTASRSHVDYSHFMKSVRSRPYYFK